MNSISGNNFYALRIKKTAWIAVFLGIVIAAQIVFRYPNMVGYSFAVVLLFMTYMHFYFAQKLQTVVVLPELIVLANGKTQVRWADVQSIKRFWLSPMPAYQVKLKDSGKTYFFYSDWGVAQSEQGKLSFRWVRQMTPFIIEKKKALGI